MVEYYKGSINRVVSNPVHNLNIFEMEVSQSTPANTIGEEELTVFKSYLVGLGLLLSMDEELFSIQLSSQANMDIVKEFAQDFSAKYIVVSKVGDNRIEVSDEWNHLILKRTSLVLVKKSNFSLFKGIPKSKINDMVQVANLSFESDVDPIGVSYNYVQKFMIPLLNAYKPEVDKKSTNDKNAYGALVKKVNELNLTLLQCQQNVSVPEVKLEFPQQIKDIVNEGTSDKFLENIDKVGEDLVVKLQEDAVKWKRDLEILLNTQFDLLSATTLQEQNFWSNYMSSLRDTQTQLQSKQFVLSLSILQKKGKHHITMAFDVDLGTFKNMFNKANNLSSFFKDLKIDQLMTSHKLSDIVNIITNILTQFKNIIRHQQYQNSRALQFIEVLSRDLNNQMVKILSNDDLMFMDYANFKENYDKAQEVFKKFDENASYFVTRRTRAPTRLDRNRPDQVTVTYRYLDLKGRLEKAFKIRELYEKLKSVIEDIIKKEKKTSQKGFLSITEIEEGYNCFRGLNVLDLSPEGEALLERAESEFNSRITKAEIEITQKLRKRLKDANNANDMFRIFAKFNELFFRPRIIGAIEEYQSQLLKGVKADISALGEMFLKNYMLTENARICKVRDIPQTSGSVMWAKQISNRLKKYTDKVSKILPKNWTEHPDGRECKSKGEALARRLDTERITSDWNREMGVYLRNFDLNKIKVFGIVQRQKYEIVINFDEKLINLIKEIKNLMQMNVRLNYTITHHTRALAENYPYAVSLQESIYSFNQITAKIDDKIAKLVAQSKKQVMSSIAEGFHTNWGERIVLDRFSKGMAESILNLHELVTLVTEKCEFINSVMQTFNTCPLEAEALHEKLKSIQDVIDDFTLKDVSNLHLWVPELNKQLETIFTKRLETLIKEWISEFVAFKEIQDDNKHSLIIQPTRHELKTENNTFYLDPPIEHAKFVWLQEFHKTIGLICSLPKLQASRYETAMVTKKQNIEIYDVVLQKVNPAVVKDAYNKIYELFATAENYIKIWLNYEALWVIDAKKIYDRLGDDINQWQKLLTEIRENRKTFDNSETEKYFGPIIIDYRLVLNRINTKYDSWHAEILNHFGSKFGDKLKVFFNNLQNSRTKLQKINFSNLTADIVEMISEFQDIKKKYLEWSNQVETFGSGSKLLERQRYKYPADWLELDKVLIEWNNFKQIYNRKASQLQTEIVRLQGKINSDENTINERIKEIENIWNKEKPSSGEMTPKEALQTLEILAQRVHTVKDSYKKCCQAKQLLGLTPGDTQKLEILEEDIEILREVWRELEGVWQPYETIKDSPITAVTKKTVTEAGTQASTSLGRIPAKLKSNEPYEKMKAKIGIPHGSFYKINKRILDLKEDCMKPRHWKILLTKLGLSKAQSQVTFYDLWSRDLNKYKNVVDDVFIIATGENVLENMLSSIKDHWGKFDIELFRYQSKCNLIRGWDDLFAKLDEDLNNLSSMKMSQYYKTFEEEIAQWDSKLQKVKITLEVWIDVQKKWVYLEGIFMGSSDIKETLSNQYTRFKGIDNDFVTLMKKVSSKPNLIEIMNIPGLEKTLERLLELLDLVKKALGDYLETQRSVFARFYFVGDEDLLQIMGNSKDVGIVQRHFTKMYAGITSLKSEKENGNDIILKMCSREGEIVDFKKPVSIAEDPKINAWLTKVDNEMRYCLAANLESTVKEITALEESKSASMNDELLKIVERYPAQIVLLGLQVLWSTKVDIALTNGGGEALKDVEKYIMNFLSVLAESVMADLKKDLRQKFEQAITDFVHQRDVVRILIKDNITSNKMFAWLYFMRFIYYPNQQDILKKLLIQMANANFHYGFEYLGVGEKLVQTPLTDRCFLTLTQALHLRMGGAPFGPAGTGKTESVKALGAQLGRFVLVFNCDETFDLDAMGRIFIGLCQVGAWGCFDEFNRLEERMLSACSEQILIIQTGLRERKAQIELMSRDVKLNPQMGSFVTMNPGYAGRSNLPENLKQLFRQMAMVKPDRELIAQVMLYSQGYRTAEQLAGKIVSLFELCNDQLSSQPHYDFGLRALKSVLVSAGNMKREEIGRCRVENIDLNAFSPKELEDFEQKILLRSVCETVVPKLIADDIPLLSALLSGVFPGSTIPLILEPQLRENLSKICRKTNFLPETKFIEKILQLFQIQRIHHGLMMVGPSGCGKTRAWQILLQAMEKSDSIKGETYVIDPKAITKDELYGRLDNTTLEWTDGVFTGVLRKITENQRGEAHKRHWIIFDGDVDPEWAQNLNSVLDDNKLLTLPNGERIQIPPNVRIMFEVQTLKYATLATVSRCGMVWFSDEVVNDKMMFFNYMSRLRQEDYDNLPHTQDEDSEKKEQKEKEKEKTPEQETRDQCVDSISKLFEGDNSFASQALVLAESLPHVMEFTKIRTIEATFALIRKGISNVLEYNESHPELSLDSEVLNKYMNKWTLQAFMWGCGGSMTLAKRGEYSKLLADICPRQIQLPAQLGSVEGSAGVPYILIDFRIFIQTGEWSLWKKDVPTIEIDPQRVTDADLIIPTIDTLRHQQILCSWLSEHRPFILCGPPGSGKTMTLMSTLKNLPEFEMIFINFSSGTTPPLIMKQFDHYCEYIKTVNGIILRPKQPNKWLVVFCDEINLPDADKYQTMVIITFLRQLTEQRGFWRSSDRQWVKLERIQFVGACNPPTDIGRKPLSARFLRHCPLMLVDFPGFDSLKQIFGTFNKAMLKRNLSLRSLNDCLTLAMIEFYTTSQNHFTADMQPHYIYSPRQLTRWKYALNEAIENLESTEDLVRLWAHEALRLFCDRLVEDEEKKWCENLIDQVANKHFPGIKPSALERPILFSKQLTKHYVSVDRNELKHYIEARLKIFYEEQLNVPIVVFDEVLQHILRIDRVLRQPLGHLLLVGASGVGKTTLSRFASWINNINVFQIKAGKNYSLLNFDDDLRDVMKRAGVRNEKICFIFDESNCLSPAFLEKMNALLASGQIPGLFEGEEYMALINQCKEAQSNKMMDADDQLYRNFIKNVQRNLHVVFTMNPNNPDFSNRTASSPALFNRCVIDWFGEWSQQGLYQVAKQFTQTIDPLQTSFNKEVKQDEIKHNIVINTIVSIHNTVGELNQRLAKSAKKFNYITPRDFLDFIKHFTTLYNEKKSMLQDQQFHLHTGLDKLKQTENQVIQMQTSLDAKKLQLENKEKQASVKMTLIVKEKTAANELAQKSAIMKIQVEAKQKDITETKIKVENDLAEAKPALERAKQSVEKINPSELATIKAYPAPPDKVAFVMQPIYYMLKKDVTPAELKTPPTWAAIKGIMQGNFSSSVISLKAGDVPDFIKKHVLKNYINSPNWKLEEFKRASGAIEALAMWLQSTLSFADILTKVQPMEEQIVKLQIEGKEMEVKLAEVIQTIEDVEKKTKLLEQEYESLIKEKQSIQSDMEKVLDKVTRSKNLLIDLESEKYRWEDSSKNFKDQLSTMLGDVFLSSAFLSYIGFFDHYYRKLLVGAWKGVLENYDIRHRSDISLIEFLSNPSERLIWRSFKLPADDLCTENAIILKRFNRYPLIIDPAGQAMEFISSMLLSKKVNITSFVDKSFMKHLETSLRFGFPLIVQDVEKVEPILNSVLNKEIYKTGGRVLIRVGDTEIDFNPNFSMYMITRDSNARFTPDLCSRVTFVNFTITPSSLEDQCLNIFLRSERPEIEEKRVNLMKLQGEYIVKLRELQDSLLDALNNVQGSILESETVIGTLETLKTQAAKVTEEMKQSNDILNEVLTVTNSYKPLAQSASKIYFAMLSMSNLYYLYEYSLQFFMDIIFNLLESEERLSSIPKKEFEKRKTEIFNLLFQKVFLRVCNSLLVKDNLIFALKLAEIKIGEVGSALFDILIKGSTLLTTSLSTQLLKGRLNEGELKQIQELTNNDLFANFTNTLDSKEQEWISFIDSSAPENAIPKLDIKLTPIEQKITDCILIKIFRPDRFSIVAHSLLRHVLGDKAIDDQALDIKKVITSVKAKQPILLSSAPGFDPSFKVESTSKQLGTKLTSIAIGSDEGAKQAEQAIKNASKGGLWVMLKNVHLAPISWLSDLEKQVHVLTPNPNFRLFLTAEFSPKIPSTLIRQSYKVVLERPDGIKASLIRTYKTVLSPARSDKLPTERSRLHFLIAYLHAVIIERLRYTPIGWTKVYEFNEADQRCALDLIDEYIDAMGNRNNIDIDKIPWDAFKTILIQNIYGGKIDNEYDSKVLISLVDKFFTSQSFDSKYPLYTADSSEEEVLTMPEAIKYSQYLGWIEKLPDSQSPAWSGLPVNVQKILKSKQTERTLNQLFKLKDVNEEQVTLSKQKKKEEGQQVAWLKDVLERIKRYEVTLPKGRLERLERTENSLNDPLFRFLEREVTVATGLLEQIQKDNSKVKELCEGKVLATNVLKALAKDIHQDAIPKNWVKFTIDTTLPLNKYIPDLKERFEQFNKLIVTPNYQQSGVWFGGLLYPEAYMTATRQYVAQKLSWSLEQFEPSMTIYNGQKLQDDCFLLNGLSIEGANWDKQNNTLSPLPSNSDISHSLPTVLFRWVKSEKRNQQIKDDQIMIPVYLNKNRKNIILSVKLRCGNNRTALYQKGVAVIAWS